MKRASQEPQVLGLNKTDFERAAGGRKIKASFRIQLEKGRVRPGSQPAPLAKDLAELLQLDETSKAMLTEQDFEFSMNTSFQLLIKKTDQAEIDVPAFL